MSLHTWSQPRTRRPWGTALVVGLAVAALAAAAAGVALGISPSLVAGGAVGLAAGVGAAVLLHRRPWLAPWGALALFTTSSELRLRIDPTFGVVKDAYVLLLIAVVAVAVLRDRGPLARLRPLAVPMTALAVLVVLYLVDPAGTHGAGWVIGARLLLEVLALLVLGLLTTDARRALAHLTRATAVFLPFQAVFAWVQQLAGADALVYVWGYQFGAQVRLTTGAGLRTSGTFEDPFQLAAFAVLGLALALFVAKRTEALLIAAAAVAVFAATSVRTALIQAGILVLVWVVRRGWARQAVGFALLAALAGVFLLATTTSSVRPGAPEEPLLFTLNGRSDAWALAVPTGESIVIGNGVGARGIGYGADADGGLVSASPAYDPENAPEAQYAGNPAFLDSAYAQIQSDVGVVGSLAFVAGLAGLGVVLIRRTPADHPATWAALAVLAVSAVDWIGRSSLASYTTGFLTLYVLGVLLAASHPRAPGDAPTRPALAGAVPDRTPASVAPASPATSRKDHE